MICLPRRSVRISGTLTSLVKTARTVIAREKIWNYLRI